MLIHASYLLLEKELLLWGKSAFLVQNYHSLNLVWCQVFNWRWHHHGNMWLHVGIWSLRWIKCLLMDSWWSIFQLDLMLHFNLLWLHHHFLLLSLVFFLLLDKLRNALHQFLLASLGNCVLSIHFEVGIKSYHNFVIAHVCNFDLMYESVDLCFFFIKLAINLF